jgi:CDP-glucose 4,6-dehydratase
MVTGTSENGFWTDRTALITGVYGFLAGHLAQALLEAGARVVGLYRDRPAESYLQIEGLENDIILVPGDVTCAPDCRSAIANYSCSVVFHLAAQALVGVANRDPAGAFETNIAGTWKMLEAARQINATDELVDAMVVASSDKAYGDQPDLPYSEQSPLVGMYPYDASKACADLISRTYHNTYGLPVSVTRCGNLFGPGDLNLSRIVPDTIRAVVADEDPVIRSDGSPKRDYLYIKDAADGYMTLAQATAEGDAAGRAYNLGTGRPLSVLQLVTMIIEVSKESGIQPDIQGTSWGEIKHQYLDATRAREQLGWQPATSTDDALRETYTWYKDYLNG